jgi:hypothetical protein
MKRRSLLRALAAATPLAGRAQQPAPSVSPAAPRPAGGGTEIPKLETSAPDEVGEMAPRFFNAQQFAALRKLGDALMPALAGAPGSSEARAPEFLDFLISESPADRQQLYRAGLDALNAAARRRFNKPFAETDAAQANELLSPLRDPWTFEPPSGVMARFLRAAKADVRTATMNSREYAAAASTGGRRGFGGQGLYWYPLD